MKKTAWNKGIPWSESVKNKISQSSKGRSVWNKGIPRTEEERKKMSQSLKGRKVWNKGRHWPESVKMKISQSLQKREIRDQVNPSPESIKEKSRHAKRNDRQTYGDPIDFRGLRHAPVNEDGVIFLFGMVARELNYFVEAVQVGFPDCEAKRKISTGKWERVRIEFEFESRNFRNHKHSPDGCDVIVCWHHNWSDCPEHLEIIELAKIIKTMK